MIDSLQDAYDLIVSLEMSGDIDSPFLQFAIIYAKTYFRKKYGNRNYRIRFLNSLLPKKSLEYMEVERIRFCIHAELENATENDGSQHGRWLNSLKALIESEK